MKNAALLLVLLVEGCGGTTARPRGALDAKRVTLVQLPGPLRYDPRLEPDAAAQQVAEQLRRSSVGCGIAWVEHHAGSARVAANFGSESCPSKMFENLQGAIIVRFTRDEVGLVLDYNFDHVVFNAESLDGGGFGASADGALLVAWGRVAQWHDGNFVIPPPPEDIPDGFWHWDEAPEDYKMFVTALEAAFGAVAFVLSL